MGQKKKNVFFAGVLIVIMLLSIVGYSVYTRQQIYYESTQNLLSTYGQVTKTFTMFVERNQNILEIWSNDLAELAKEENTEIKWRRYVREKANWQYSEVVLFNQEDKFWTVSGRQGDAPHMESALKEVYTAEGPIVTSYISSQDVRKVMFAVQIEPVTMDGVVYTSLAICYDNTPLENLLGGLAYEGQSDCYIVRSNGDVVLSTEPKSEITERLTNLFDYLSRNTVVRQPYFDQMLVNIPQGISGSVKYTLHDKSYYLVYQSVGIKDWAIVGIVPTAVMDEAMIRLQTNTTILLTVLALVILAGAAKIAHDAAANRRAKAEAEKLELQRRKELSDQMFQGMARIVDRFAVCDLENDRYIYHERRGTELYPPEGEYHELLEQVSLHYAVLTDGMNAKLNQMLSPDNLREMLKKESDAIKFEYAARDKSAFMLMTVVPTGWQNGQLTRMMMISQDMGQQHMLENLANTDGLTELLNKRYFDMVLAGLEKRNQKFALFYLDLDRFKPINDTYGHDVGDHLLQEVARRLQGCVRSRDYAFRLGGDEFALLLTGDLEKETCSAKMRKIQSAIAAPYHIDGKTLQIGTSCGYALYPEECPDTEQLCHLADQRMYSNKQKNHAMLDHGLRAE